MSDFIEVVTDPRLAKRTPHRFSVAKNKRLLAARQPGRNPDDARDKEIERLKKANARLELRAYFAEQLVDIQKKSCTCSRV